MTELILKKLTEENFADYESLIKASEHPGCYCAFWYQKWPSMEAWKCRQAESPELNRQTILDRVRSGFHVGVLAYSDDECAAWISVAPLPEFFWSWRRVAQLGESARTIAGITCISTKKEFRGRGFQKQLMHALIGYGKALAWTEIEAYPFDPIAVERHKDVVSWPGWTKGFADTGFTRVGPHWLSQPEWERSIYKVVL